MPSRPTIALEIGRRRLRALAASRERDRVEVKRAIACDVPDGMDPDDPTTMGAWIREQLDAAGFPSGRATVALAREHVALKRLTLPTTEDNELPEMTRLALQRELPFDATQAVIDYVPLDRDERRTTVLAVAAPRDRLERTREIVRSAGLGVDRIALRAMGSAALVCTLGLPGIVLAVDVTGGSVEFCIVDGAAIRFSRAAELADRAAEPEEIADAVLTETRRTWMSYRIVEDAGDVSHVVVMGDARVTQHLAGPMGEILGVAVTVLDDHPRVEPGRESVDRVWPLAGLLLEPVLGHETIDFEQPRSHVDMPALVRRRAIIAAGALVMLLLAAWTISNRTRGGLRSDLAALEARRSTLTAEASRIQREAARLIHLDQWSSVDVRWLEHLDYLNDIMPPPGKIALDGWTGSLTVDRVRYDRKDRAWSVSSGIGIVVEGEAVDRVTADGLRDALVQADWSDVSSAGTESRGGRRLPVAFTYRLRTDATAPPAPDPPIEEDLDRETDAVSEPAS